jgi:hypothetical protein
MAATPADVVNEALELTAQQVTITDLNDGSVAGNAAGVIYKVVVRMLLRKQNPDFARAYVPLTLITPAGTPFFPWALKYQYPFDAIRARCITPPSIPDPNDPQPVRAQIGFDLSTQKLIIATNQANAGLVYTTDAQAENFWDQAFEWTVVRALAEPLSMALAGRPDFAQKLFMEAEQIAQESRGIEESVMLPRLVA